MPEVARSCRNRTQIGSVDGGAGGDAQADEVSGESLACGTPADGHARAVSHPTSQLRRERYPAAEKLRDGLQILNVKTCPFFGR